MRSGKGRVWNDSFKMWLLPGYLLKLLSPGSDTLNLSVLNWPWFICLSIGTLVFIQWAQPDPEHGYSFLLCMFCNFYNCSWMQWWTLILVTNSSWFAVSPGPWERSLLCNFSKFICWMRVLGNLTKNIGTIHLTLTTLSCSHQSRVFAKRSYSLLFEVPKSVPSGLCLGI